MHDHENALRGGLHASAAANTSSSATGGLNALAAAIHRNAVAHGWWDEVRTFGEIIALCHSELSEALEEFRDDMPDLYYACWRSDVDVCDPTDDCEYKNAGMCMWATTNEYGKPEGIAIELADCMIRILDYCAYASIDIEEAIRIKHEYNKTRPYRHGGKKC